jgi:uncharacterized protein YkwD
MFALVALLMGPFGAVAGAAEPSAVQLRGTVKSATGDPIAGALVTVNDQQFTTDADGRWDGRLPFEHVYHEWATAEGYAASAPATVSVSASGTGLEVFPLPLDSVLPSLFDVDPTRYQQLPNTVPPTITLFATDQGLQTLQVLPADTQAIVVQGTVGSRDGRPLLRQDTYLAHPDDSVERLSAEIHGDQFSATFPLTSGPGKYQIELVDTSGSAIINAPLFVGVPYTPSTPIVSDPDLASADSEQQALDRLGEVRAGHGLQQLEVDPRLAQVARDHLADMVANNWWCHCWADGSSNQNHLTAAGVPFVWRPVPGTRGARQAVFGEGIESGESGAGAVDDLFQSPGHRFDLLGDYTHVGVAVGREGESPLFVIEYAAES